MFHRGVAFRLSAAMPRLESSKSRLVEPPDQLGDDITALSSGQECRLGEAVPIGHRQQGLGSGNQRRRFDLGTAQALKSRAFLGQEWPKGLFLTTRHVEAPSRE